MNVFTFFPRAIVILFFFAASLNSFSQVDKEFWFSIPYANKEHGLNFKPDDAFSFDGGQPLYLRFSTLDNTCRIRIETPASPGVLDTTITVLGNSTATVDLTPYRHLLEVSQTYATIQKGAENKGIHISSSDYITAYFENATRPNPEIFALKGKNALGTEFYTPFQTRWPNDPLHNYREQTRNLPPWPWTAVETSVPDSAFSAFDIVATEDGTVVYITPATDVVGHKKGETFSITLKRGQTYSVRAISQGVESTFDGQDIYPDDGDNIVQYMVRSNKNQNNLSGSHVTSNNPIAVSVKDDSVFPNDLTRSGDCEDYIGDQIVPVDVIGKEYLVMRGLFDKINGSDTLTDWVFVVGTVDGTQVSFGNNTATVGKGQTLPIKVSSSYMHIVASHNVYAFHITGYQCEFASALLPPINTCTGSSQIGFSRTYGTYEMEKFYANILVRKGGEKDFESDGQIASKINVAAFTPIPGSDWSFAQVLFDASEMPVGNHFLRNTSTYFHFAFVNSTAFQWAETKDWLNGDDMKLQGASYGYFSNYGEVDAKAIIVNSADTIIQVPQGNTVQMVAFGGVDYVWSGKKWNEASSSWEPLPSPFFLDKTTGYNPLVLGSAPIGKYEYTAEITPACASKVVRILKVEVIAPVYFVSISDTICEDAAGTGVGAGYNLNNLTPFILADNSKRGYYVDSWNLYRYAGSTVIDNFDETSSATYTSDQVFSEISNTETSGVNTSDLCLDLAVSGSEFSKLTLTVAKPIILNQGALLKLQARPVFGSDTWLPGSQPAYNITMTLRNGNSSVSVTQAITSESWQENSSWDNYSFDFSGQSSSTPYSQVEITVGRSGWYWASHIHFDNIAWVAQNHLEEFITPQSITINNMDTVYAVIKNDNFPYYKDTSMITFAVLDKGRIAGSLSPSISATQGKTHECFDLTQLNNQIGGALIASKEWYTDAQMNNEVTNETCTDITDGAVFYVKINDKCQNVGIVSFDVTPVAEGNDTTVEICPDINNPNLASGIILNNFNSYVIPPGSQYTVLWYSDAQLTTSVNAATATTVTDNTTFHAKIMESTTLIETASLTFDIAIPSPISVTIGDKCSTEAPSTATVSPSGGVFSIDNIKRASLLINPAELGVGSHNYSYETSGTCPQRVTGSFVINNSPHAGITAATNPVAFGETTTLTAIPGGSGYTYQWSPAALLTNGNSATPTTTKLTESTDFCLTVTHNGACADDTCITVDVTPANNMNVELTAAAVCLGQTVNISSRTTGGTEPYSYKWSSGIASSTSLAQHTPAATGQATYSVTVTDATGLSATGTTTVDVNQKPIVELTDATVCQGDSLSITPTVFPNKPQLINWKVDTLHLNAVHVLSPSFSSNTVGTYSLALEVHTGGCFTTDSMKITVKGKPLADAGNDTVQLANTIFALRGSATAGTEPYKYQWSQQGIVSANNIASPSANISEPQLFTLTVTDSNQCSNTDDIFVNITNTTPQVLVEVDDSTICGSKTSVLVARAIGGTGIPSDYSFVWYKSPDFSTSIGTGPSIAVPVVQTSTYRCVMTNAQYAPVSDDATITVYDMPDLSVTPSSPIVTCVGNSLTVTARQQSGVSFEWFDGMNPSYDNFYNFNNSKLAGTYNLLLKASNTFCIADTAISIRVNPQPTVTLTPSTQTTCAESPVLISAITSLNNAQYSWTANGIAVPSSSPSYNFPASSAGVSVIGISVSDANGCSASTTTSITVNTIPASNVPRFAQTCQNERLILDFNPSNLTNPPSVTWINAPAGYRKLLVDTTTNPAKPVFESTAYNDATLPSFQYIYILGNGGACPRVDTLDIVVNQSPLFTLDDTIETCVGNKVMIITSNHVAMTQISWDGPVFPNQQVLATRFIGASTPGSYTVSALGVNASYEPDNSFYCTTRHSTTVIVHENPVAISGTYPEVPYMGAIALDKGYADPLHGKAPFSAQWLHAENISIFDAASNGFIATTKPLLNNTNFKLMVTDANGCKDSSSALITVFKNVQIGTYDDKTNRPVDLTYPLDRNNYINNELDSSHYVEICAGQSVTLLVGLNNVRPESQLEYEWTSNTDPSFLVINPAMIVSPITTTTYTLKITDAQYPTAYFPVQEYTVEVHERPRVSVSLPNSVYVNEEFTITGKPSMGTKPYKSQTWTGSGIQFAEISTADKAIFNVPYVGTYDFTYSVKDLNGCSDDTTVSVTFTQPATIKTWVGSNNLRTYCFDADQIISISVSNPVINANYEWSANSYDVTFINDDYTGERVPVKFSKPGVYKIYVENTNIKAEEPFADTIEITIVAPENLQGILTGDQNVCEYQKGSYLINKDKLGARIEWKVPGAVSFRENEDGKSIDVQWGNWGQKAVYLVMYGRCADSAVLPVAVHKNPESDFVVRSTDSINDKNLYIDQQLEYDNRSFVYSNKEIDNRNLMYYWDFVGDQIHVSNAFEPVYSYDNTGTYPVMLIAVDSTWGCRDTMIKQITIIKNPNCEIKFPNTFTPTDNDNYTFSYGYSKGLVDTDFSLKIYNRWGQMVWETKNKLEGWNGKFRGADCKQDVYVYHCSATCENGTILHTNGDLTLIK